MDGHMHHISFFATRPSKTSIIRSLAASVCNTNAIASIPAQSVTITKAPIVNVPKSATATVAKPVTITAAPKPAAAMSTVKTQKTSSLAKSQPQAPPEANKSKSPTFAKQSPCTKPKTPLPPPPPPPLPPPNEIKAELPPVTSTPKCQKSTASTTASSVRRKGFFRLGFIPRNILKLSLFYITASMVVDLTSQK